MVVFYTFMVSVSKLWPEQNHVYNFALRVGPSSAGEKEAAAARANYPIPPACGIYYYEVSIESKGAKGYVPHH